LVQAISSSYSWISGGTSPLSVIPAVVLHRKGKWKMGGAQSKSSRWDAHVPEKKQQWQLIWGMQQASLRGFDSRCNYEYFLTAYCVFVLPIQSPSTGSHWGPDMSASNKQTRTNNWISFDFNAKGDLESSPIKINDTRIPSSQNVGLYIKYLIFCCFFRWVVRYFNFVENWIALPRGL